jgi:hypothetical protein
MEGRQSDKTRPASTSSHNSKGNRTARGRNNQPTIFFNTLPLPSQAIQTGSKSQKREKSNQPSRWGVFQREFEGKFGVAWPRANFPSSNLKE